MRQRYGRLVTRARSKRTHRSWFGSVISLTFLRRRLFIPLPGITFIRKGVTVKTTCHWVNVTPALPCFALRVAVTPRSFLKQDLGHTEKLAGRAGQGRGDVHPMARRFYYYASSNERNSRQGGDQTT